MVQLFKIGSGERLLMLLAIFGLMQAPFLLFNDSILVQELLWIRLGERLADGWRLYAQAADDTAPIPAMMYGLLAKAGLHNFHMLRILGTALVLSQALWLNQMAFRYQLVADRNYLMAFFYIIFIHTGPDAVSLSPILISCSFILFSLGKLFKILKDGASSDDAMVMGIWLGLAFLSYQPALIFILPIYISALFFSGLRINHYFLIAAAAMLPLGLVYACFIYGGGSRDFSHCFFSQFRFQPFLNLSGLNIILIQAAVLLMVAIWGWAFSNQNSRVNFHRLGFNVFFFSTIAGFASLFLGSTRSTDQLLLLVPQAAYFMGQFVIHSRKKLFTELAGISLAAFFLFSFYRISNPNFGKQVLHLNLFAEEPPKGFSANFQGQRLLLLDNDFRYYLHNPAATRFFRHYLSGLDKQDSQTYEGLIYWYQCLAEDPPKIIYDPHGLIPNLALHIPEFTHCYRATFYPNLYQAIPGKVFGKKNKVER